MHDKLAPPTTRWRPLLTLVLLLLVSLISAGVAVAGLPTDIPANSGPDGGKAAPPDPQAALNKIAPDLMDRFTAAGPDGKVHYWVIMAEQANTANNIPNSRWAEKGWYVYNLLVDKANTTQTPLLTMLETMKAAGSVTSVESFWIINLISVTGNQASAMTLAAKDAVALVQLPVDGVLHYEDQAAATTRTLSPEAQAAVERAFQDIALGNKQANLFVPLVVQHNINEVHAPQAWTMGYDGAGVVVSSMDSGVRSTHEALSASYRGNVAPPDPANIHDYNWYDGYLVSTTPIDLGNHGSHTMGTVLGLSPNPTYGNIGVAKGATWTTVRICGVAGESACDGDAIMRGFQWTLAPTRVGGLAAPRPDLRPRVSNNSWGGSGCNQTYNMAVANWVNAGIFPAFSNGNSGPAPGSAGTPGNAPLAWGTGNLATNLANWVINTSSSRGPSPCDGSIRPQAVAPGTLICSTIGTSNTAYSCSYSGTSMAAPHVTGAIAILAQKNNELTSAQMMYALTSTAFFSPTWGTAPNNNYGWGLIQIDAALNSIQVGPTATPTSTGTPPTATNTPSPTATICVPGYSMAQSTATIIPATNDIGNHCDDCTSPIYFPFPVSFYGTIYTQARASSNGNIQFTGDSTDVGNRCMPKAAFETTAFLYQNDLRTDEATCPGGCGIFTATVGTSPNRIFVVEWRTTYWGASGSSNEEMIFYENNPTMLSMVYGTNADNGLEEVAGVQYDGFYGPSTQFSCAAANLTPGLRVDYTQVGVCPTPVPTATPCTLTFTDVDPNHTFYPFIRCLACRNIINGYTTGCPSGNPCFRPENNVTRGQVAKIVSNAAGFSDPIANQSFEDVPVGSTFHEFVGRLAMRGIVGGYACGGTGEPCNPPLNLPYFRPNANVTRGQLAKMDSEAAGYSDVPSGQQFEDVAQGSTFYTYTYRLAIRTIMSGYACGGTGEPCNPPLNLPYFRPGNPATRGQTAKIVANTFYPNCNTPRR